MTIFGNDGRLIIPIAQRPAKPNRSDEEKVRYIIEKAFCPKGCSIIDESVKINGYPGLRIKFRRNGVEGEFVISAIEGDFEKVLISGTLINGVRDELFCPHCGEMFRKLVNCNCQPDGEMVVVGLTPELNYNEAITFCNITGCHNGAFIKSGDAIRHVRLLGRV